MTTQAYDALATEARNSPALLTSHKEDLHVHDHKTLTDTDAPKRCGWILTQAATYLVRDNCADEPFDAYRGAFNPVNGLCRSELDRFYLWNGSELKQVTHSHMFITLASWGKKL